MIDTFLDKLGISESDETLLNTNIEDGIEVSTSSTSLSSAESTNSDPLFQQTSTTDNLIQLDDQFTHSVEGQVMSLGELPHTANNYQNESNVYTSLDSIQTKVIMTPLHTDEQLITDSVSSNSSIDVDNLVNIPTTDNLEISNEDLNLLQEKVDGIERCESKAEISFGRLICPTRGGCQGATDCDYSYGSYQG